MILVYRLLFTIGLLFYIPTSLANTSQFGGTLTTLLISKDPHYFHGIRASIWYQPESFIKPQYSVYFDASIGHWYVSNHTSYRDINIIAVAPVLRLYFAKYAIISPFIELSIGPAYLSKTHIDSQNLGMHFAFQDQIGIGGTFGKERRFAASIAALHYSNGSLCANNSGITVPVILNVSYRFG